MLHGLKYEVGAAPVVGTDNTAIATGVIDTQGASKVEFVILTGTLADADATFAVTMLHGENSNFSDNANVPASDMVGDLTNASFDYSADNSVRKVGYQCTKRYVKLTITPSNNTGNAPLAVAVVKYPLRQPQ